MPVIERLKPRFLIARIGLVADRGMISVATLAELDTRNIDYIGAGIEQPVQVGSLRADV